ncbi:hypothetical protein FRX31_012510 [Thalictrum thalictroides]|uniref:Uncharacterized protein n=1 Tax=Thalictrum thalictroides TaxID=46969 RepID=A0A7J6WKJ5_THATH|nr:hypothetical protein FRX31_012510 [Thalictrum thalictroides]
MAEADTWFAAATGKSWQAVFTVHRRASSTGRFRPDRNNGGQVVAAGQYQESQEVALGPWLPAWLYVSGSFHSSTNRFMSL